MSSKLNLLVDLVYGRRFAVGSRTYDSGRRVVAQPRHTFKGEHEPWMDALYNVALEINGGSVVDVGVNLMQTLFKILAIDPLRSYVGFEPQMPAALIARDFAARNGLSQVTIICTALSEDCGLAQLKTRSSLGLDSSASITDIRPDSFYHSSEYIPTLRGDAILGSLCPAGISLLNVDVEGAEREVLYGCRETLTSARPVVAFEVLNDWVDPAGNPEAIERSRQKDQRAADLSTMFAELGFDLFSVRAGGIEKIDLIRRRISDDLSLCNYAAVPQERRDDFLSALRRWQVK